MELPIEQTILEMTRELESLRHQGDSAMPRREELFKQLRLIGMTASFFGGWDAMKKLHDAAENLVGNTNQAGFYLNNAWDMIGDWVA